MAGLSDFGITSIDTSFTRQFKLTKTIQETDAVLDYDGTFATAYGYNEEIVFEAEGAGDAPADFALGGAGPTIAGLTGGVTVIDRVGESQSVGSANGWSASGEHAPDAE